MRTKRPSHMSPCAKCGTPCRAATGLCRPCLKPGRSRPSQPCDRCGKRTWAVAGTCRDCLDAAEPYGPEDELTDGRWVLVRGVRRWVPNPGASRPVDPPEPPQLAPFKPERVPHPCPSEGAYQRHRRDGGQWPLPTDDPCGCRAAHSAYVVERNRARRDKEKAA